MKTSKKHFAIPKLFLFLGLLTILFGCQKEFNEIGENSANEYNGTKLSKRSCEAGNSTVSSGVLDFDSIEDFLETVQFLSCTDSAGIASWRASNGFKSSQEYYLEFLDQICCDTTISRDSIEEVVDEYANHIKVIEQIGGFDTIYEFDV